MHLVVIDVAGCPTRATGKAYVKPTHPNLKLTPVRRRPSQAARKWTMYRSTFLRLQICRST
jgi:hypothetical protein